MKSTLQSSKSSRQSSLKNPIYRAVMKGNYELLTNLLKKAKFDDINDKRLSSQPLDLAARRGDSKATELLLNHGALPDYNRINQKFTWSQSTLGRAIQSEKKKVIRLLIDKGCDMDTDLKRDTKKWSECDLPYNHWSKVIQLGKFSIFKFLIKCTNRQICDDDWNRTLLLIACHTGSIMVANYLIVQGVSINTQGPNGGTGLFYALTGGHIDIFEMLIDRGADVKLKNHSGSNLLHIAAQCCTKNEEVFRKLLDLKLDVNLQDKCKRSPLHYAVQSSSFEIVKLLIERGAYLNFTDLDGRTPFHLLFTKKPIIYEIINLLLRQEDIDLAIPDNEGVTILHLMAANSTLKMRIRNVIFRPEVDFNARDKQNKTPLHYLLENNRIIGLEYFLDLGADTEALLSYYGEANHRKHISAKRLLMIHKIKLETAGLKDDNINAVVKNFNSSKSWRERLSPYSRCLEEINRMKVTPLVDQLTYYDFLHANREVCLEVAKMNRIKKFNCENHGFFIYDHMLIGKCLWGVKEVHKIRFEAFKNADNNLNFISNGYLPDLVVYNIHKYLDIDDLVTLQNCSNTQT